MSYTVTVITTSDGAELVSAYLYGLGAEGVSILDKKDLDDLIANKSEIFWDYIEDELFCKAADVHVTGFYAELPTADDIATIKAQLDVARAEMPVPMGPLEVIVGESTNDDQWYDNWKAFYKPIKVGDITVVPEWQQADGDVIVKINPCMAFGTGEHESTQMCLALLQKLNVKGKQIIDVGCGSGILGIAALKLGAKHCYFADIDGDAMRNMRENANLNEVTNYEARTASLLEGCTYKADVMLANITADILMMLSKDVAKCLANDGCLIISGIIAERQDEVLKSFADKGFRVIDSMAMKDWRAFTLTK